MSGIVTGTPGENAGLRLRTAGLFVLGWTIPAVLMGVVKFLLLRDSELAVSWYDTTAVFELYWLCWGLVAWLVLRLLRLTEAGWREPAVFAMILALVVPVLLVFGAYPLLADAVWGARAFLHGATLDRYFDNVLAFGYNSANVMVFLIVVAGCAALHNIRMRHRRERDAAAALARNARLEGELARAQLDALRLQLHPHFLFNALNSIAALIQTNERETAYTSTTELAGLLRDVLSLPENDRLLPFAEELRFARRYLNLQRLRFGDRLKVEENISADCLAVEVPPMILQPLLENCFAHAVDRRRGTLHILMTAQRCDGALQIRVADNGRTQPDAPTHTGNRTGGVGHANLRARLQAHYGTAAQLAFEDGDVDGHEARLTVPVGQSL